VIELRHERERRGWTLDDVVSRTRIPRRYLEALEDGNHDVLPPGPFLRGFLRQYLEFLGQDPDAPDGNETDETIETDDPPDTVDLIDPALGEPTAEVYTPADEVPLLRLVIAGFVITLAIVLALQVTARLHTPTQTGSPVAVAPIGAPQRVRISAIEDVKITATVDGEQVFDGTLKGRDSLDLEGKERVALDVDDLERVQISYNKEQIEPLHNLSRGRRLVFIRDQEN